MGTKIAAFLVFLQFGVSAQTLKLSSAPTGEEERITIEISFKSPDEGEASALQWEITILATQLSVLDTDTTVGPAAEASGKSLSCALKSSGANHSAYVCILYGGRGSIGNGVVAKIRFKIASDTSPGSARVRISNALAVSKDLKRMPVSDAETIVHRRAKPNSGAPKAVRKLEFVPSRSTVRLPFGTACAFAGIRTTDAVRAWFRILRKSGVSFLS